MLNDNSVLAALNVKLEHIGGVHGTKFTSSPAKNEKLLVEDEVEIVLQVNGKVRGRVTSSINATDSELEAVALADPRIRELTAGKTIRKVVVVPKRLVNVVAD